MSHEQNMSIDLLQVLYVSRMHTQVCTPSSEHATGTGSRTLVLLCIHAFAGMVHCWSCIIALPVGTRYLYQVQVL